MCEEEALDAVAHSGVCHVCHSVEIRLVVEPAAHLVSCLHCAHARALSSSPMPYAFYTSHVCVCVCVCARARVCVRVHTQASWQTQSSRGQTACCGCGTAPAFYQTGYRLMKSGHLPKYICALRHSHTPAPVRPLARARTRTRMRTLTAFPCACGHVRRYNAFGKSGGEYPPEAGADACWESQRAMQRGKTKTSMGVRASGEH